MAYFIGQGGNVRIGTGSGAATICVENWQLDLANDSQDVTTTCSAGFQDLIAGITSAQGTFTGFYDDTVGILTPCQPGFTVTVEFLLGASGASVTFEAIVTNVNLDNPAKAPVKFTVTVKSTGPISTVP